MRKIRLITHKINCLVLYLIAYSFIGWCIETIFMSVSKGAFVKRGFMTGPFCLIYGFGALLLIMFLKSFKHNIFIFFFGAILITTSLEYIVGTLLEVLFQKNIWWDYYNEPFNLNGKICLKTSIYWGFFAVIMIYFVQPLIKCIVKSIPVNFRIMVSYVFATYVILDLSFITFSLNGFTIDMRWLSWLSSKFVSNIHQIKNVISASIMGAISRLNGYYFQ